MTWVSLFTFFIALLGIIAQIILRLLMPNTPHGITTVLVVVLFIGAIQMLGISILGQYIGKIFEEVKQRPKYVVKSIYKKELKSG
jgi:dolichol-phosphate mannosyltransferase